MIKFSLLSIIENIPSLIFASLIVGIGFVIAVLMSFLVRRILYKVDFDYWVEKYKVKEALLNINISKIICEVIKWYIFLIFILIAFYSLELNIIAKYLADFLFDKFVKIVEFFVVVFFGAWLGYYVKIKIEEKYLPFSTIIGNLAYFFIIYFTITISLPILGLDNSLLVETFKILIIGVSVGIGIALGIGFGLALRDYLEGLILEEEIKKIKKK